MINDKGKKNVLKGSKFILATGLVASSLSPFIVQAEDVASGEINTVSKDEVKDKVTVGGTSDTNKGNETPSKPSQPGVSEGDQNTEQGGNGTDGEITNPNVNGNNGGTETEDNGETPVEEKPVEEVPVDKPSEETPSEETPNEEKPSEENPSIEKPSEEKPSVEKPSEEKPSVEKPSVEKPSVEKPSVEKPSKDKPSKGKPSKGKDTNGDGKGSNNGKDKVEKGKEDTKVKGKPSKEKDKPSKKHSYKTEKEVASESKKSKKKSKYNPNKIEYYGSEVNAKDAQIKIDVYEDLGDWAYFDIRSVENGEVTVKQMNKVARIMGKTDKMRNSNIGGIVKKYADDYNLNAGILFAMTMYETGWGSSSQFVNLNNTGGLECMSGFECVGRWSKFDNIEDSIERKAQLLAGHLYVGDGRVLLYDVISRYAPATENNVNKYVNDIGLINEKYLGQSPLNTDSVEVRKAKEILKDETASKDEQEEAEEVLSHASYDRARVEKMIAKAEKELKEKEKKEEKLEKEIARYKEMLKLRETNVTDSIEFLSSEKSEVLFGTDGKEMVAHAEEDKAVVVDTRTAEEKLKDKIAEGNKENKGKEGEVINDTESGVVGHEIIKGADGRETDSEVIYSDDDKGAKDKETDSDKVKGDDGAIKSEDEEVEVSGSTKGKDEETTDDLPAMESSIEEEITAD